MNHFSFWDKTSFLDNYDVVIAGSGIVGLNAAWTLKKESPDLSVLVIDRGSIPSGASTRNAGVACFGTVSEIVEDLEHYSEEEVFSLIDMRWKGLWKLRSNLGDKNIGFENLGGFELYFENEQDSFKKSEEKIGFLNTRLSPIIGSFTTYKISEPKIQKFGFQGVKHVIENVAEGQIDSGKMMFCLLQKAIHAGVVTMYGTEIKSFSEEGSCVEIECSNGIKLKTKKLLIATNGFTKNLIPDLDVYPARAQVLLTSAIAGCQIKGAFHFDKGFYFFRNIGDRILFGGGRNLDFKTEETMEFGLTDLVQNSLEKFLRENILPGKEYSVEQRWSGIMGMGKKKLPIIKKISERVFCAVRMSGMGVAIGSQAGEDAAKLLIGTETSVN